MIKTRNLLGIKSDFETNLANAYKVLLGDEFDMETFIDQIDITCGNCGDRTDDDILYRKKLVYLNNNIILYKKYCNFISDEELSYVTKEQIQKYIDYNNFKENSLIYLLGLNCVNIIRYKIIRLFNWYCIQERMRNEDKKISGERKVELLNKAKAYIKKVVMCEELEDPMTYFYI